MASLQKHYSLRFNDITGFPRFLGVHKDTLQCVPGLPSLFSEAWEWGCLSYNACINVHLRNA